MTSLVVLTALVLAQARDAGMAADAESSVDAGITVDASPSYNVGPQDGAVAPDAASVNSRPGHLRGQVLTRGARGGVVAAGLIVTADNGFVARIECDDEGHFDLPVPCGNLSLLVRAPGYQSSSLRLDVCKDSAFLRPRLAPLPNLPVYETLVTAPPQEPKVELRGQEMTTTPGALGDPLRTIESLPGVASVAWPAPIYAIRGSNPGNTGYFLDDLQVPQLFHLALGPSVIHPEFFEGLSFYPGGYPVRYGRYVAGIVSAQTRAPAEDRMHASAELRLYDAGAMVSAPLPDGNGAVAVALRYSYAGALLSLLRNDLRLSYWDYQLRLDRRIHDWRLVLLLLGSGDDLAYHYEDNEPMREYALRFHRASLRAYRPIGVGELSARLALGTDYSSAPIVDNYPIHANAKSIIPRLDYQRPGNHVDWEIGADGQVQWLRPQTTVVEPGASDLASNRTAYLAGGYLSASVRAGDRLTMTPGLRVDSYRIHGASAVDWGPRLVLRLKLDEHTWLSGNGGRFSQAPSLTIQIPAAENFGLGLYGLQTSWQGAVGLHTDRMRVTEAEVTVYVQRYVLTDLRDPTLTNPDPLAGDFLVRRNARSYGLEVMLRRPASHRLHGWLSYTLSQSERALGGGLIGPSDWDQRHILNGVIGYRVGHYELGARGHLNTGRPVLVQGGQSELFARLPTFYQLDARAERRFLFDSMTLHAYVEVVNATLSRETYALSQSGDGAVTPRTLLIVLPSIGVRGEM